jgi:ABC-type transport system involved in multi-copper enzyme maturation permease subunit
MRWGLGPVFLYECLANSRRWQTYALRSAGVAVILAAITMVWISNGGTASQQGWREYAALGESYFYAIIGVELTLVLLAAPAASAGALCVDRARGTLDHMLATELSDPEIVLGKLAARLLPVLGLVACSWPVLALASLLGGIDPVALTLAFAIILAVALLGCTMALALSVWARRPHEVVLVVYTSWMLVMLLWPIWYGLSVGGLVGRPPDWSLVADPYYLAFAPYSAPGRVGFWAYLGFFAATLGAAAALAGLAVWRMRPVARQGTDASRREPGLGRVGRLTRWLPGPSLDGNPVLWREWHRSRPSRWMTILIVLVGGSTGIACVVGAVMVWRSGLTPGRPNLGVIAGVGGLMLQLIFGLLMLSAVAPMAMSEERQRGSLDLLAATTLSTRTIVLGKWLAMLRLIPPLALGPALLGFVWAVADKAPMAMPPGIPFWYTAEFSRGEVRVGAVLLVATVLAHGALIASVGLALSVWVARQGRAIALSVGFAVIVGAGWPILVLVGRLGPAGPGLMSLSPVAAVGNLAEILTTRLSYSYRDFLWWTAFWIIECLALALGLLWLTVRTFDGCFGRIPERPGRAPVLSDIVVVLAAWLGIGGLFWAGAIWINGPEKFRSTKDIWALSCAMLAAIGFHLLSALAASGMSRGGTPPAMAPGPEAAMPGRKLFAIRWWEAFRPVLLLAIGPALLALALATASTPIRVAPNVTNLPGGGKSSIDTEPTGIAYVATTDASGKVTTFREPTAAELAAVARPVPPPQGRGSMLAIAGLAVVTILAHGAAFVSLGAAMGIWIRRRGRAIAASVGLVLFVTVGWPILCIALGSRQYPEWGWTLASVLSAFTAVVFSMDRPESIAAETLAWVGSWNAAVILVAAIVSGLAIRTLERRSRRAPADEGDTEDLVLQPAGGEARSVRGF